MNPILKSALHYVNNLKWSVIPIKNKIPQVPSWKEYQQRYPTEEELKKWFHNREVGIGIVTGRLSHLSVIDVDDKDGLSTLKVGSNIVVQTPRGSHLYFQYHDQLKNWVKPTNQNWDVRTEGGYVVAPPTPSYKWRNPWFTTSLLLPFPINILPKETSEIRQNGKGWIADALRELHPGNRDITFTRIIGRLHHSGYDEDSIKALLSPYAESSGFGIGYLNRKVEHITNDYPNSSTDNNDSDSLGEFLRDLRPIQWICEPIIGQGTFCFVAGLPKTLKTWICADLAIEVARGGKWLGKIPVNQGIVLFIDQERYKGEVQRRFKALMSEKGLTTKDLEGKLILKSQTTTRIDLEESFNAFRKRLMDIRPNLIVIDSFATFHTREENNRQDIQFVLERIKQLRSEFGCTIVMIDHENKSVLNKEDQPDMPNAFSMVGSIGKSAAAETVLTVRKLSEVESILYHTASNLGPTIEPIKISIRDTEKGVLIS